MIRNHRPHTNYPAYRQPHVVFAGGGTGGHLFPGLAVAAELRRRWPRVEITFVGAGKPIERQWVAAAGHDYVALPCRPVPTRFWNLPGFLRHNYVGYRAARRLLTERPATVVVGLGGYASAPMARAARRSHARLVLLEQNTVPGRATRWLARSADAVCVAFPQTVQRLRCPGKIHVTGTPIRPGFAETSPVAFRRRLLVLGGSAGAEPLNQCVPRALYRVRKHLEGGDIVHHSGPDAVDATAELYRKLGLAAEVVPFVVDMPRMLSWTGLAVSRAGGSALAELAAAGVPAVLIPYPHAVADHQRRNAELFRDSGGCVMIDQRALAGRLECALAEVLASLLADCPRRQRISHTIRSLARPDAARDVAQIIERLLGRSPRPSTTAISHDPLSPSQLESYELLRERSASHPHRRPSTLSRHSRQP